MKMDDQNQTTYGEAVRQSISGAADAAKAASRRPVAFRVPRADPSTAGEMFGVEWRLFQDEGAAREEADALGVEYQGLYVRDGSGIEPCKLRTLSDTESAEVQELSQRLAERTTERDYHMRMADKLAERIREIEGASEALTRVSVSLMGALSYIKATPECKTAAPSDKIFDKTIESYEKALEMGKAALSRS
jgi:hypothetical protein